MGTIKWIVLVSTNLCHSFLRMDASMILSALGGEKCVSEALRVPMNTVTYWRRRNSIPPAYWAAMVDLAGERAAEVSEALIRHRASGRRSEAA